MKHVLIVDDDRSLCETLADGLSVRGFSVSVSNDAARCLERLDQEEFDAVLCDLRMPEVDGIALTSKIRASRPDLPVVVLTAFGSVETAVQAVRAGAYDFLAKPVKLDVLAITLQRAVENHELRATVRRLQDEVARAKVPEEIVTRSDAMRRVMEILARVAGTDVSVLVTGESGTGKELVARAIHNLSARRNKPFVAINCAAVPESLLESELFGHVRGAFTDAHSARVGLFREASGGTVLLDEIGDMPIGLQPKLLRVLEERKVRPVGASAEQSVDVRFVAATNQDLEALIEERRFREDLFFRLNVVSVVLPPLRSRGEAAVLALAHHFLRRSAHDLGRRVERISAEAAELLVRYDWPGNVRELRNCIERAVALARYDQITPDDLPEKLTLAKAPAAVAEDMQEGLFSLEEMERRYVRRVLAAVADNKAAAARILGIERKSLYRKLDRWRSTEATGLPPAALPDD